jgi:phage major head subunit gpT-like protein
MGSLTKSNFPETIRVDLDIEYGQSMEKGTATEYQNLIEIVPTTSTAKREVFYGDKGQLRRFRSERQPQGFREYKQVITLDDWEYTETVPRSDLEDVQDPAGYLRNFVGNFANVVATSKEIEFWEFLRNGVSITGYDKDQFFSFNHTYTDTSGDTVAGITQANMHLGGSQLDTTTIALARQHFAGLVTDTGKAWKGRLTDVVVYQDSDNHNNAREIANSQYTVQASTVKGQMTNNIYQGSFNIIPTYYGIGTTEWMSLDLSNPRFKPVKVLSHTVSPGFNNFEFSQQTTGSYDEFWRRDWAFGVFGRFDYNPGYWQTAYLHGSSNYTFTPADSESQRVLMPNA